MLWRTRDLTTHLMGWKSAVPGEQNDSALDIVFKATHVDDVE